MRLEKRCPRITRIRRITQIRNKRFFRVRD